MQKRTFNPVAKLLYRFRRLYILLFSLFFIPGITRADINTQAVLREQTAELLRAAGFEEQIRTTQVFLLHNFEKAFQAGLITDVALKIYSDNIYVFYDPDYLLDFILNNSRLSETQISILMKWYGSELGRKIVALENASASIDGHLEILESSKRKLKEQASEKRIDLIKNLYRAFPVTSFTPVGGLHINNRIVSNLYLAQSKLIKPVNTLHDPEKPTDSASLYAFGAESDYLFSGLLFSYGDLTESEINQYRHFLYTPPCRDFLLYFYNSYYLALDTARKLNSDELLLIQFSGMGEQIKNAYEFMLQGVDEGVEMGFDRGTDIRSLKKKISEAYSRENMIKAMQEALQNNPSWLDKSLEWYGSNLGQRIVALENQATTVQGHRSIQQYSLRPLEQLASPRRIALVRQLYETLPWAEYLDTGVSLNNRIAANLALTKPFQGTLIGAVASPEKGLDPLNFSSPELKHHYILSGLIWAYRDLSDQDLEKYIRFLASSAGQSCQRALFKAYTSALDVGRGTMAFVLASEDTDREFPDAGRLKAKIVNYGALTATPLYRKKSPATNLGNTLKVNDSRITEKTRRITADLNLGFGIEYVLQGDNLGQTVSAELKVIHPPLSNPRSNQQVSEDRWITRPTIGKTHFDGWKFENPWEMVPGIWIFEVWFDDQMLAQQHFEVVCRNNNKTEGVSKKSFVDLFPKPCN